MEMTLEGKTRGSSVAQRKHKLGGQMKFKPGFYDFTCCITSNYLNTLSLTFLVCKVETRIPALHGHHKD